MILLDTNVVSELMRETPEQAVREWVEAQNPVNLGIATITIAEIQYGIARLPQGKRRTQLTQNFEAFVGHAFDGRIFPFHEPAAYLYGAMAAAREQAGVSADTVDMMIAAIAKSEKAAVATRNTKDFEKCGLRLINPWRQVEH